MITLLDTVIDTLCDATIAIAAAEAEVEAMGLESSDELRLPIEV